MVRILPSVLLISALAPATCWGSFLGGISMACNLCGKAGYKYTCILCLEMEDQLLKVRSYLGTNKFKEYLKGFYEDSSRDI